MNKTVMVRGAKAVCLIAAFVLAMSAFAGCRKTDDVKKNSELAKSHFDKGVNLWMKRQYDGALKEFDETLKLSPASAESYNNKGFIYFDKGDFDKAADAQKKALEINPKLANAYYGLAQSLEMKGDKPSAIGNYRTFMQMSEPHSKWWMQAQAHIRKLEGREGQRPAGKEKGKLLK